MAPRAQLLCALHPEWLSLEEVARGFEHLLARVDDLAIDNPRACEHLANFLTRAVSDEILPPAFVTTAPPEALVSSGHMACLTQARAPLVAAHFGDRRRHVWGAAADGSLEELKNEVCRQARGSRAPARAAALAAALAAPSNHPRTTLEPPSNHPRTTLRAATRQLAPLSAA